MYSIPFVDSQGNPQTYSSEFDRLYQGEMTGGLMIKQDPIVDFNTGRLYATYDNSGGVPNQDVLNQAGNEDADEDSKQTDVQALQSILNDQSLKRGLTDQEKRNIVFTGQTFDPRFRRQLIEESIRDNSDMFSINTTDLIEETQKANQEFTRQENLETLTPNVNAQLQQVQAIQNKIDSQFDMGVNNAFNSGIDILFNLANEEKAQQRRNEQFRARQMGRQKPTMSELFQNKTRI